MPEQYMSTAEAGHRWGISGRRVSILCKAGRISGAMLIGGSWIVPADVAKPEDARIKSGRYIKQKEQPEFNTEMYSIRTDKEKAEREFKSKEKQD